MTTERTGLGQEIETALDEVAAHVRGEVALPCRIVDAPGAGWLVALRKRLKLSPQQFADRFGLDVRAVHEWEQGRRVPDRTARVLLTAIDRDPESTCILITGTASDYLRNHRPKCNVTTARCRRWRLNLDSQDAIPLPDIQRRASLDRSPVHIQTARSKPRRMYRKYQPHDRLQSRRYTVI